MFYLTNKEACRVLHCDKTREAFENRREMFSTFLLRLVFSTFLECFQMSGVTVFYHSVIHRFRFLHLILRVQNNKTRFFYVLYSDKTWVFDQSERAQGPTYIITIFK